MSVFFYFLPGTQVGSLTREAVRAAGLGEALRDCLQSPQAFAQRLIQHQIHSRGPDGSSGVMLIPKPVRGELPERIGVYADSQSWKNCGGYWLGFDLEHRPQAEALERPELVPGVECLLGDGRAWKCPTIRRMGRYPALPQAMGLNAVGEFEMQVLPDWEWAWNLSGQIFDQVFSSPSVAWETAFGFSVAALGLNYRIGPREASALGLITTLNVQSIMEAVVDWIKVKELLEASVDDVTDPDKKKEAGPAAPPVNTSPGLPGD